MTHTIVAASDGQHLAVTTVGSGPDLLAVPGGPARAVAYLGDLGGLDSSYTLHLLDTRGSGGSQPAEPQTLTLERLARDLIEVVALLDLDRPVLLAHSFGTRVAMTALTLEPALARAVVLVTPPIAFEGYLEGRAAILDRREADPTYAGAVAAARALPEARPRDRSPLERASRPLWYGTWDDAARRHAESAASQVNVRTAVTLRSGTAVWAPPVLDLSDPVLVIGGELDVAVPPACARAATATVPRAVYAEIAGAGHFPWLDDPAAFAALVDGVSHGASHDASHGAPDDHALA